MATSDDRRGGFKPWCSTVSDMWRTSRDLEPNWQSVMFNLGTMVGRGKDAGPYIGWNNPDVRGITTHACPLRSTETLPVNIAHPTDS
eukprot:SAG31_NODE_1687_length_7529_cov_2.104172_8_plen_87_part_00